MANKTFHIPKSAIVETEDNVSILKNEQQTITTDASAVATLENTDGFKAAHYSIAAERDGEVETTTTTTTTTVTGSGGVDADTKLLLNANYIYDESFSKRDITLNNTEVVRKGYYFDGSDDYISAPASSDFDFGTGAFTIEFWFKASQTNSFERFVSFGTPSSPFYYYTIAYQPSGQKYEFVVYNGGGWESTGRLLQADASDFEADVWTHLALVRESGDSDPKLYINGVERSFTAHASSQSMPSLSFSSQSGALLKIGSFQGSVDAFNGYMSDIRISKGNARYTADFDEIVTTKDDDHVLILTGETTDQSDSTHTLTFSGAHPTAKYGQGSFYFDGSNDYISIADSTDLDVGTGDYTFELWFKTSSTSRQRMFADYNDANKGLYVDINSSKIFVFFGDGSNYAHSSGASATVTGGVWHHLALVFDGTNCKVYIDGTLDHTISYTSSNAPGSLTTSLALGRNSASAQYYFNGYMSDIRISKGVARYTAAFTAPTAVLQTEDTDTKLLLNVNSALQDFEINRMASAPTYDDVSISTSTKKFGDGSYDFDGSSKISIEAPSSDFDWSPTDKSWTWELWYNVNSGQQGGLIGTATSTSDTGGWDLYLGNGNNIGAYGGNGSNTTYILTATSGKTYTTEEWRHIAVSYDQPNNKLRFFNDGTMIQESTGASFAPSTGKTLNIGDVAQDNQALQGYIDDVRVTIGQARYTASFDVPTSELGGGTSTTTTTETTTTTTTGSSDVVLTKVHLVHDGSNVYFTEYGRTATDDDFLELSASYDAGVAKLHASTTSGSATLELTKKEFDFSVD